MGCGRQGALHYVSVRIGRTTLLKLTLDASLLGYTYRGLDVVCFNDNFDKLLDCSVTLA